MMHEMVVLAGQIFVAGVLGISGWHKLTQPNYYRTVIAEYFSVGKPIPRFAPILLGTFEFSIGVSLLFPATSWIGGICAALLIAFYGALIAVQLIRGNTDMDCGCTGPAAAKTRISPWLLVRNALLLGFVSLSVFYPVLSVTYNNWVLSILAGGFLLAVYFAVEQLFANAQAMAFAEEGA